MKRRPLLLALGAMLIAPLRARAAPDRSAILRQVYSRPAATIAYSPQHAALMRLLRVQWLPIESGAPGIDVRQPLQGGQDTLAIARKALHTTDDSLAIRRLAEVCRLIPRYVEALGMLRPGRYAVPAELRQQFQFPDSGVDSQGMFEIRKTHMALLRAVSWLEVTPRTLNAALSEGDDIWPMPYIDGKRPYGSSTYFQVDMARILGEPYALDAKGYAIADPAKDARLQRLHHETLAALQIFLNNAAARKATRGTRLE